MFAGRSDDDFSKLPWYVRIGVVLAAASVSAGGGYVFALHRSAGGEFRLGLLEGCLAFGVYVLAFRLLVGLAQTLVVSSLAGRGRGRGR